MTRTEVINTVAAHIAAKTYLEIGVYVPARNFDQIWVDNKVGVDPSAPRQKGIIRTTSQEYFEECEDKYDLIFIDGDHRYAGCRQDIDNAWDHLAPGGVIIMHDVNPESAEKCLPEKPYPGAAWSGECWKVYVEERMLDGQVGVCVPTDHGVGILQERDTTGLINSLPMTFGNLDANRGAWLNIIEPSVQAIQAAIDPLPMASSIPDNPQPAEVTANLTEDQAAAFADGPGPHVPKADEDALAEMHDSEYQTVREKDGEIVKESLEEPSMARPKAAPKKKK